MVPFKCPKRFGGAISFRDKRTGEIKYANAIIEEKDKVSIQFKEGGEFYRYNRNNVELFSEHDKTNGNSTLPFVTYEYNAKCYACRKQTSILTYIVFNDGTNESAVFPWDKERALKMQDIMAHMQDPSCEYYGISVIGEIDEFDKLLMERYPERISIQYSGVVNKSYPMNLCEHCGAKQGNYYIYRYVNDKIKNMESIDIVE